MAFTRVSCFFFFKQKTAYDMRISDWSADVCSSDLRPAGPRASAGGASASRASCARRAGCFRRACSAERSWSAVLSIADEESMFAGRHDLVAGQPDGGGRVVDRRAVDRHCEAGDAKDAIDTLDRPAPHHGPENATDKIGRGQGRP